MKIYEGRPDHNEGRLEKELAVCMICWMSLKLHMRE